MPEVAPPKSIEIVPSGFFAFRTPLLPFDALASWSEGLRAPTASPEELASALAHDRALLEGRLRALVMDPVVREALFVASPSLDDAIDAWLKDPRSERARGVTDIVVRYFGRMSSRCTPFGLFSGCSLAPLGVDTRMTLAPRSAYVRQTRLDTHYLSALCDELLNARALRESLRFRASSGLFRSGGQLRYAEGRTNRETRERTYSLVSVEVTPYLDATLARAGAGAGATLGELARGIADADPEVSIEEASGYVDQLVDSQILVSDLAPTMTGAEPIDDVVQTLRTAATSPEVVAIAERVASVGRELERMDHAGLGLAQERYKAVATSLAELPAKTELPRLFQVDLFKPAPGSSFGGAPLREIQRTLDVLARFRRPASRSETLRRFREAFQERYEGGEARLAEVLDEERGIGVDGSASGSEPSPLLADLPFPGVEPAGSPFGRLEDWLIVRLADLARKGEREWALDARDLTALDGGSLATPPDALAVMLVLGAPSPEALAKGEFKLALRGVSGPSGAVLLGRFCHGDDELTQRVRDHLRAEEALRPDAIFAEIVHLPEGRLGNILCRPLLREYEIPYLGRGGAAEDKQIPITDLLVSIQGERIVLRSERLGREVIPRLTSAHNYSAAALGTYRFLCMLQSQDADRGFGWSWGAIEQSVSYLPRVTYGRTILSLARWNLRKDDLASLGEREGAVDEGADVVARFRAVQALRRRLELPRWIGVADGDNVLTVDLDNVVHVDSFVSLVKKRPSLSIQEVFPSPEEMCARGPEGRFAHEIVVPFVRTKPRVATALPPPVRLARSFTAGSEWLFAKIYTGTATADRVLNEVVTPLVEESLAAGDADAWFFLRYGDPRWHVRVRLHGDPSRLTGSVIPRLHRLTAPFLADGRVWRVSLDTYEREVERYGGDEGMLLCESLFGTDSEAVLRIQNALSGDEAADARWRLTLRGMHLLLLDLGLDLPSRAALLASTRASFAAEHRVTGHFEKQLGAKFRKERPELAWLLGATVDEAAASPLHPGFVVLAERSVKQRPIAAKLAALAGENRLMQPLASLARSLLHMHANRLLRSEQRAQELVLYDFLARLYQSEIAQSGLARERRTSKTSAGSA
jgi:thiopeptide-type bacteriocin biosynthesis protein